MFGADDGVTSLPAASSVDARFTGSYERRDLAGAGHNLPQEHPEAFASAILDLALPR
jgi:pimeloyl-ACP methyl ester carboxylesterase